MSTIAAETHEHRQYQVEHTENDIVKMTASSRIKL